MALKLDLDGIYFPSFNKSLNHLSFKLKKKFLIIGSAHNLKELKIKILKKIKIIFISSLFKKNKNYLGINKFKNLINLTNLNIVALGGINKSNYTFSKEQKLPQEVWLALVQIKNKSIIGIPKEDENNEKLICRTPDSVQKRSWNAFRILVQT